MRRFISWRAVAFVALAWLALPAVALADDCSSWSLGELPSCALLGILSPPLLVAGALLCAAAWLRGQMSDGSGELTPAEQQETERQLQQIHDDELKPWNLPEQDNSGDQNRDYNPGGISSQM